MREIINFAITFAFLLTGCTLLPDYLICTGGWEFILVVTAIYWVMKWLLNIPITAVVVWICYFAHKQNSYTKLVIGELVAIVAGFASTYISLFMCSCLITGFTVVGNFTYIVLIVLFYIFQIKANGNRKISLKFFG